MRGNSTGASPLKLSLAADGLLGESNPRAGKLRRADATRPVRCRRPQHVTAE
jgi:hypothetical protein